VHAKHGKSSRTTDNENELLSEIIEEQTNHSNAPLKERRTTQTSRHQINSFFLIDCSFFIHFIQKNIITEIWMRRLRINWNKHNKEDLN
jgi:hypothetical protein